MICPECLRRFKDVDLTILDEMNVLRHPDCFQLPSSFIKDIRNYAAIKDFWFSSEKIHTA